MNATTRAVLTLIGSLFLLLLACTCAAVSTSLTAETPTPAQALPTLPSGGGEPTHEPIEAPTEAPSGGHFDTEFPIPDDAQNFVNASGTVNFQTGMKLNEVMEYYRHEFSAQGYTERQLLTVTSDTTFSMVFDGHASGKSIVVQGVDLGNNSTNVSLRLEAVP